MAGATLLNGLFGRRLKEFREAARMSEAELASRIGQDIARVNEMEMGGKIASAMELWDICIALDVEPHEFFVDTR